MELAPMLLIATATFVAVDGGATPRNLQQIFIGNCWLFQESVHPGLISPQKNCTELWEKFKASFAYKNPCDVNMTSYDDFLKAADHDIYTADRVLLFSGSVYPLVYDYTADARRWLTVRDYLAGFIMKTIDDWCGQPDEEGMNFESCPSWRNCSSGFTAYGAFWRSLSRQFSSKIKGDVHVLLNGSSGAAFRSYSVFAQSELSNLHGDRHPVLHVWVIHDVIPRPNSVIETCNNGSLLQLKSIAENQGMRFNCTDDPLEMMYFQCTDFVGAEKCKFNGLIGATYSTAASSYHRKTIYWATVLSIVSIVVHHILYTSVSDT